MTELVAVDIGGTHVRFAIAEAGADGAVRLGAETVMRRADHASLEAAWSVFAQTTRRELPRAAALAVACPVDGEVLRLTNSPWVIRPSTLRERLRLEALTVVNDFGAVAYAVGAAQPEHFRHLCGPEAPLPAEGVVSVIGPGTGLGVAQLVRREGGALVVETEGGHIGFAPTDDFDDALLRRLRARFGRVSVERVVSGAGLSAIHEALGGSAADDDKVMWARALEGADPTAAAALDRFCLCFGSAAGDIALSQGASAVVIAGGLGLRLVDYLPQSPFAEGFLGKGRFAARMAATPVKLITHPQPGLFGAAASFRAAHSA